MKKSKQNMGNYFLSILLIILYLFPIYVLFMVSIKPMSDYSPRMQPPAAIYWENYMKALLNSGMLRALGNTLIMAVGTVLVEVVVGALAAYPLARVKSKVSSGVMMFILAIMMIPGLSLVVGIYSTLVSIQALNTYWGVILVSSTFGLPMVIYLYRNFITSIPATLDEAAAIDGAGVIRTFIQIIMPQLKPVTVTVILLQGVGAWNEYGFSLYILQKPQMYNVTLTVKQYFTTALSDLNGAASAAMIAIIPIIILYVLLQKYFVRGAMDSAIKG